MIEPMLRDPDSRRLPSNLLYLMISGLRGVWLRNIELPSKSLRLKHLFKLSAFTLSVLPPPFVRQAKGIFKSWILTMAYYVWGMGTVPLTSTPSISEIITGLNDLDLGFSSSINFFILLAIEFTLGFIKLMQSNYKMKQEVSLGLL